MTPQTIRNLFTGCTSRRYKLVPTKTAPWAVLDNLEAVIGPHEKRQGQKNTTKAIKISGQVSLRKFTVEESELQEESHSKEEVGSKKKVSSKKKVCLRSHLQLQSLS